MDEDGDGGVSEVRGREVGRVGGGGGRGSSMGERAVGVVVGRSGGGGVWGRVLSRMLSCVGGSGGGVVSAGGEVVEGVREEREREREIEGREREREREGRRRGRDRERERERVRGRGFGRRGRFREGGRSFAQGGRRLEDMEFLMVMNRVFEEYREREWERERGGGGFWESDASGVLAGVERAHALEELLESLPTFVIEKEAVDAVERLFGVLREGTGRVENVEEIFRLQEAAKNVKQKPSDKRDGECVICLGSYEVGDEVMILPCTPRQHFFHAGCIRPWVRKTGDCPCCCSAVKSRRSESEAEAERVASRVVT